MNILGKHRLMEKIIFLLEFFQPILAVDVWPSRPFVFLMSNLRRIFLIFFPEFFLSCLVTFIGLFAICVQGQ